jgi:hydroxymethylpyrimidine pyrophosphatase-like HAD family hydrolase
MRCVYLDLDGTLIGPGGSLLRGPDGGFALEGVRALQACFRADVEVMVYSGRRQASVFECARVIGAPAYTFEVGCGLVIDGALEWLTDGLVPSAERGTIYMQIEASGAPRLLLERFAGLPVVHAYHLIPAGASKARAVARHMQARAYTPEDVIAVGDSREDLGVAGTVGCFWLVANALERDPGLASEAGGIASVRVASDGYGAGVYEAVVTTLAERR